jgi:hypothetical protein
VRPYGVDDPDDAVEMVGHDGEFVLVQADFAAQAARAQPFFTGDLAEGGQLHLVSDDLAKDFIAPVGDQGDEIRAGLGVIVPFEADRAAVVSLRIVVGHLKGP